MYTLTGYVRPLLGVGVAIACAIALIAAAPQPGKFPPASASTLPNGVIVTAQISNDAPIAEAQVFVPAGLAQQSADSAGVAAVTAATVLRTPVSAGLSVRDKVSSLGGLITYTVDPEATRFQIESQASDLPQLLHDLAQAIAHPDPAQFPGARDEVTEAAKQSENTPALVAYAMIRQVRYQGSGFAYPQGGRAFTLARLTPSDMQRFAASYLHGNGTIVALTGALSQTDITAAGAAFAQLPATPPAPAPAVANVKRQHEILTHRDVQAPWLAIGYSAPSQFSKDFATMLVIEALLGRGGDEHALSFGSTASPAADDYVGAFYEYEAHPGSLIIFLNGGSGNADAALRQVEDGISRLRGSLLPAALIARGKNIAVGDYYLSVTSLGDAAWLLGRSAASPDGVAFENALAARIAAVTPADVQRVAKQYLSDETIAVVLPTSTGR